MNKEDSDYIAARLKLPAYDFICRICKEAEVNHTRWLCDECGKESLRWFYEEKEKDNDD